jgi:16S rRNA (cytidine1402-2'-O)-methyltransferase
LESVADLQAVFGDEREIVLAREITKLFENFHRCRLGEATAWLNSDANNQRGEFVVLVAAAETRQEGLSSEAEKTLSVLLEELPLKQAVQLAVKISGANKNELYQRALELKVP